MTDNKKRIAVVTGANRGIGFEVCRELAQDDIDVILTSRDGNECLRGNVTVPGARAGHEKA